MDCRCGASCNLRRKKTIGGKVKIVYQCGECLRIVRDAPARVVMQMGHEEAKALPWAKRKVKRRPNSKTRAYQKVLQSPRWKKLREEVLERDGGECQLNLWGCTGRATEAHHLSYDRLGYEKPEDLAAACRTCNQSERQQRITRHVLGPEVLP